MATSLVFSFIGADKPGLVEMLSNTVTENGGNWLESRMSQLAGHFTGITRVSVSTEHAATLRKALEQLSSNELTVNIQQDHSDSITNAHKPAVINLVGQDRPGIVHELSSALALLNVNVCEMDTNVTSAPMTAEPLFEAMVDIQVPTALGITELSDKLDDIANQLAMEISLEY